MIEFIVKVDDKIYEISEMVTKISFRDSLNDGCSKLEFSYVNKDLNIKNGSFVRFSYKDVGIFQGYVFKASRGKGMEISITAYDQLRYCKAKDTVYTKDKTVSSITEQMCNYFHLKKGVIAKSEYLLTTGVQDDKSWLDIIYSAISDTLLHKKKWYVLRDEFGSITLREIGDLELKLIIGDSSLCYDYKHELSIDDEFYNLIKLVIKDEETKSAEVIVSKDDKSVSTYGLLQYYKDVDKKFNTSQIKEMADNLLSLYNKEAESVSFECIGDTSIRAGNSFQAIIEDINLNQRLIVKSVTHNFIPNHTMSLEVMA
ncbi:MAG: phage protein [Anaerocolumna sp.]|jgi:hypothetical protein|nr:phage protein [Anaerocolumna sp.]